MTALPGHPNDAALSRERASGQPTALVVDASVEECRVAGALLENSLGMHAILAASGTEALTFLEHEEPSVVIADLRARDVDILELIDAVRKRYPLVPVIILTIPGGEELALQALRHGAASYVPKKKLNDDLVSTVEQVLAAVRVDRRRQRLLDCLTQTEVYFVLENDPAIIPALVAHFQEYLLRLGLCDQTGKTRVGIALEEALLNALYHGNLELSSALRQSDDTSYYRLAMERCRLAPFQDRRLHVRAKLSRDEALFTVKDEGRGFDPSTLPDPTDLVNLGNAHGRGLLLIRTFMDEVRYNEAGTEITMIKRRDSKLPAS